ncbi:MAG: ABC transporter permease [bacterium]
MQEFKELVGESLGTLTNNKLRTGLAVLGIVIGIGSVIALISLGQASQQVIQSQIQSLGSNLLTVNPGAISQGGVRGAPGGVQTLTLEDAEAIASSSEVTTVSLVSPEMTRRTQLSTGKKNTNIQVVGALATYQQVHKTTVDIGQFISDIDVTSLSKVMVLGPQVVTDLFGEEDPIGQSVRIGSTSLRVIGVTAAKGGTGFQNQDNLAYVPLSTAQNILFGQSYLGSIALEAKNAEVMTDAQNEVGYLLLNRHKISDVTQADFSIFSQADILNTATQTTGVFTALLSGVAAISLLVGGIGIMNIMLVTVTERTREIGLRKALGAKKKTIITQFLIESIILTCAGGIFGILFGIMLSFGFSLFMSSAFVISMSAIVLAFGVSMMIGIVFGWYPANKAANLQPIEALRYE